MWWIFSITAGFENPDPSRRWREGTLKSSFNYILLDPRVTCNLPYRAANMSENRDIPNHVDLMLMIIVYDDKCWHLKQLS